jgi:putative membrane protein
MPADWKRKRGANTMLDLALAIAHHFLVFLLAAVLAFEIGAIRSTMSRDDVVRIARVDLWYGILAAAILVVGFTRAQFAAKGWAYYSVNVFFWAKMIAFLIVGLLSIAPTLAFIRWRRAYQRDSNFSPAQAQIDGIKRFLWAEAAVFTLIPAFAAAMARGYGSP